MNLNTNKWQSFDLCKLFDVDAGIYHYSDEYSDGNTQYCSASAENNGIAKRIDLSPDFTGNKIITGKVGCTAFYEPFPFCATSDVNVLTPKFEMSPFVGLFIVTIININENYRWNYGRQCRVGNTKNIKIKLPIKHDETGAPIIDEEKTYSEDGYLPDWEFMEQYIKSLHHKPIATKIADVTPRPFETDKWQEFFLHRIFKVSMGNGIDAISTTNNNPKYNYIGREGNNNGVAGFVDEIDGRHPFPSGAITLALGGSLGACFLQKYPFYTAQNVGVLQEKVQMSDYTKLFLITLIQKECKIKYQAFGRELNAHFRKDFTIKLPIKLHEDEAILDETCEFSDEGYIPDWEWMENYIKSLPYSDRI